MAEAPPHLDRLADVHALGVGQVATVNAALRGVRHGHDRNGKGYFDLIVSDASAKLPGKIWGDSRAYGEAKNEGFGEAGEGAQPEDGAVKLLFSVGSYRDALQLTVLRVRRLESGDYDAEAIRGEGWELVEGLLCTTLVFDIETVPAVDPLAVPDSVGAAIERAAARHDGDQGKAMGLSPYFGKIVSLALGDGESPDSPVSVLAVPPVGREADEYPAWVRPMSEAQLLRSFWHLADMADIVVTFNGRGFDVPFLVTRSLILGVPARVDLVSSPFSLRPHLDLYRLLGHGRGGLGGTSLDVACWALGIESPKGAMDGSMVAPTYARGDIESIATYNAADVRATAAVYRHLRDHLLPFRKDW